MAKRNGDNGEGGNGEKAVEEAGGLGGNLYPPGHEDHSTRDTRLLYRALKNRWPIRKDYRGPIMDRMMKLALTDGIPAREVLTAVKALLEADRQNQADEHLANKNHRIDTGLDTEKIGINHEPITFGGKRL